MTAWLWNSSPPQVFIVSFIGAVPLSSCWPSWNTRWDEYRRPRRLSPSLLHPPLLHSWQRRLRHCKRRTPSWNNNNNNKGADEWKLRNVSLCPFTEEKLLSLRTGRERERRRRVAEEAVTSHVVRSSDYAPADSVVFFSPAIPDDEEEDCETFTFTALPLRTWKRRKFCWAFANLGRSGKDNSRRLIR